MGLGIGVEEVVVVGGEQLSCTLLRFRRCKMQCRRRRRRWDERWRRRRCRSVSPRDDSRSTQRRDSRCRRRTSLRSSVFWLEKPPWQLQPGNVLAVSSLGNFVIALCVYAFFGMFEFIFSRPFRAGRPLCRPRHLVEQVDRSQ